MFETTVTAIVKAVATHPQNLTADERKHLGLPPESDDK